MQRLVNRKFGSLAVASVLALALFGMSQSAQAEQGQAAWDGEGPQVVHNPDGSQFLLPGIVWTIEGESVTIFSIERLNEAGEPVAPTTLLAHEQIQLIGEEPMEPGSLVSELVIITDGLLWNTSEHSVQLLIDDGTELRFMTLRWGEGIAVGSSTEGSPTHKRGCACVCTTSTGTQVITANCPPPEGQVQCPCSAFEDRACVVSEPDPANPGNTILVIGQTSDCEGGLIPA